MSARFPPDATGKCCIWDTEADLYYQGDDKIGFESPRAGGGYIITAKIQDYLTRHQFVGQRYWETDKERVEEQLKLTTWLIQKRKRGYVIPEISDDMLQSLATKTLLDTGTRINNLLEFVDSRRRSMYASSLAKSPEIQEYLLAHSECQDAEEYRQLEEYCLQQGYLYRLDDNISLGVRGRAKLEESNRMQSTTDSKNVFIAMWFDEGMQHLRECIKEAVKQTGYNPVIIDEKLHNNKIDDEIVAAIRNSKFLIADFTCGEDGARGGVYYEAGFAHGLGVPVIFTCRNSSKEVLHFDTRQFNHIFWDEDNLEEFKQLLVKHIQGSI